jgi:hypothetical protein
MTSTEESRGRNQSQTPIAVQETSKLRSKVVSMGVGEMQLKSQLRCSLMSHTDHDELTRWSRNFRRSGGAVHSKGRG